MMKVFVTIFTALFCFNVFANDMGSCETLIDKYYSKSLDDLKSISKEKRSRTENRIYKRIVKENTWLEKNKPSFRFIKNVDSFTGDGTYRTNFDSPVYYTKSYCNKEGKVKWGSYGKETSNIMLRKICKGNACGKIQIYIYDDFNNWTISDPSSYYYGINRVFAKDIGDLTFNKIDLDLEFDSNNNAVYTYHIAASLSDAQFKKILESGEDVSLRYYSRSIYSYGRNYMTHTFPIEMFKVFNEGLD